ncbi:MAG: hypothetical protein PHS24_02585 [Bacilli bacterium]|nr:hypothetical protein [Bacilli bacterium]
MKKINRIQRNQKNNKITKGNVVKILITTFILLLITIGASFAYFTATITGSESATTITVSGGTMTISYSGGSAISTSGIVPKGLAASATTSDAWVTKAFTVTGNNTTAIVMKYKVSLVVQTNTFSTGALEYKMTATNTGSNGTPMSAVTAFTDITNGASTIVLGNGQFSAATGGAKAHDYVLYIYFLNTGASQNADKGKSFTGYLKTEGVQ